MFNRILLKTLRGKTKLSPQGLCSELYKKAGLNISRPTLLSWEDGETQPRVSDLVRLAKYFDLPVGKFFA